MRIRVYWDRLKQMWCVSYKSLDGLNRMWFTLWRDACCAACLTSGSSASACLRFWTGFEPPYDESAPFQSSGLLRFDKELLEATR